MVMKLAGVWQSMGVFQVLCLFPTIWKAVIKLTARSKTEGCCPLGLKKKCCLNRTACSNFWEEGLQSVECTGEDVLEPQGRKQGNGWHCCPWSGRTLLPGNWHLGLAKTPRFLKHVPVYSWMCLVGKVPQDWGSFPGNPIILWVIWKAEDHIRVYKWW